MPLAVQRLRLPGTGRVSYTLLGDDALPVGPAEAYLAYLQVSASPNTVQSYAHDLRDFFTWAGQGGLDWRAVSLEQVSHFFDWLRRPAAARAPDVFACSDHRAEIQRLTSRRGNGDPGGAGLACFAARELLCRIGVPRRV
jgi:hypothetical protein